MRSALEKQCSHFEGSALGARPGTPAGATSSGANEDHDMSRNNVISVAVGALIVAVAVLGYQVYQDRKEPKGVQINLGQGGLSIEKK
jgi:uncharacterized membrane protein YebE (DUF533 family)